MSVNLDPKWTKDISYPQPYDMQCPSCGYVPKNVMEVMACMFGPTYYQVRHIPPNLVFTCDNESCQDYENTFNIKLKVIVRIQK